MTITVSITEYRNRTDEILDPVIEGEETVVVTLADGRNFVLVPGPRIAQYGRDRLSHVDRRQPCRSLAKPKRGGGGADRPGRAMKVMPHP